VVKVLAFPAFKNKGSNPYNYLLYSGMKKYDVDVREFTFKGCLGLDYDLIHVHWPEIFLNSNYIIKAISYSFLFLFCLIFSRLCGKKIVWTVHNLKPHKVKYKALNKVFWWPYKSLVNAIISLSSANERKAVDFFEIEKKTKMKVIYHGLYQRIYDNTVSKADARRILNVSQDGKVCLFIGQVKPYKNVELLIELFNYDSSLSDVQLIIAGKFESYQYFLEVESKIKSNNIIIQNKFIPDSELQNYFNATDVCVFPFNDIFNSGSVLLSASFDTPVIVPFSDNFFEYKQLLGQGRVITYTGKLTAGVITQYLLEKVNLPESISSDLDWPHIQNQLASFYKEVLT